MLTASLVIGFIICKIASLVPISFGEVRDSICITFCSIMAGFILGKLMNCSPVGELLDFLKVGRTVNSYLWHDLVDTQKEMKAYITINDKKYSGYVHLVEEFSNTPHIVLAKYSINGNKNNNDREVIVLDTSSATEILIEYHEESALLKDIMRLGG